MSIRVTPSVILVAVLVGGGVAVLQGGKPSAASVATAKAQAPSDAPAPSSALPPNHPPIGSSPHGGASPHGGGLPPGFAPRPNEDVPSLEWTAPKGWEKVPNPNAMRIATYHVPAVSGDSEPAEAIVARAGGTPDANIFRWVGQFSDAGPEKRTDREVLGLKVHVVEVSGTYSSGMMPGSPEGAHAGWSLLGAVIETQGSSYFFKMIGPKATVASARGAFDQWVGGIKPVSP